MHIQVPPGRSTPRAGEGRSQCFKQVRVFWNDIHSTLGTTLSRGLACVFLAGMLVLIFWPGSADRIGHSLEDTSHRIFSHFRNHHPDLVIVAIDENTLAGAGNRWPWPRAILAKLLEAIGREAPRMILWDMFLQKPEAEDGTVTDGDREFARVVRTLGNVGLMSVFSEVEAPEGTIQQHFPNFEEVSKAAAFQGFSWVPVDGDGIIRSFIVRDGPTGLRSLVSQAARRLHAGDSTSPQTGEAMGQESAGWLQPDQGSGSEREQSRLAFARGNGGIPVVSAQTVISGSAPPGLLSGKIVCVGVTASTLHDWHQTSLGQTAGVEILAVALDTLLSGRVAPPRESLLWRFFAALAGFLVVVGAATAMGPRGLMLAAAGLPVFLFVGLATAEITRFFPPFGILSFSWVGTAMGGGALYLLLAFAADQARKAEAEAAGKIQAGLFPPGDWKGPDGFSCRGMCVPCSETGGDFYDFQSLPDGSLFFLIGDVSGHGIPAAMVTTMAKTLLRGLFEQRRLTPEEALASLNSVLHGLLQRKRVMTAISGSLEPATGKVRLSFAGHCPALHWRNGEIQELGLVARPLGVRPNFTLATKDLTLFPGDRLLLYTDGIPEARDWKDNMYGFERWRESVSQGLSGITPKTPLALLLNDVRSHTTDRPFQDDLTLLLLAWDPEPPRMDKGG